MILAVLLARMSSERLPGKVLMDLAGKPSLVRQAERLLAVPSVDELWVMTSTMLEDNAIEACCEGHGLVCKRGELEDVLNRVHRHASQLHPDHIIRSTADCPVIDRAVVEETVQRHLREGNDCTGNAYERTYPDGLDIEIMTYACFDKVWREAETSEDRANITSYIYANPSRFRTGAVLHHEDLSALRWTVDYLEDYEKISAVFDYFFPEMPDFGMDDVLDFFREHGQIDRKNHMYRDHSRGSGIS